MDLIIVSYVDPRDRLLTQGDDGKGLEKAVCERTFEQLAAVYLAGCDLKSDNMTLYRER